MNPHDIEDATRELMQRIAREDPPPAPGEHVALEDEVVRALETGERFKLSLPARAIVNAIVAEAKTNKGAIACDVTIAKLNAERVCVAVQLFDGEVVPLVVAVAAH